MISLKNNKTEKLGRLFEAYKWNYLVDAVLESAVVSRALVNDDVTPNVGVLELSNIKLHILGGDAGHPAARNFLKNLGEFAAFIPASESWEALLLAVLSKRIVKMPRYGFTSERLETTHLQDLIKQMPERYRMVPMDINLTRCLAVEKSDFASDHLLNYESPEDFIARGFGFCILDQDKIVSVATTFVTCETGIEIQINTRDDYKRMGLATAAASQIILHSLEKGLDPNWDAANESSVGLATKLGYTPQGTYAMYLVTGS